VHGGRERQVREFVDALYACDAMIWSSPTYHGFVSGSFKNALGWLILLAEHDPPYLTNKPVGLVTTAGPLPIESPRVTVRPAALSSHIVPDRTHWACPAGCAS
jgi:multimeric flavodoxin WrbA